MYGVPTGAVDVEVEAVITPDPAERGELDILVVNKLVLALVFVETESPKEAE